MIRRFAQSNGSGQRPSKILRFSSKESTSRFVPSSAWLSGGMFSAGPIAPDNAENNAADLRGCAEVICPSDMYEFRFPPNPFPIT